MVFRCFNDISTWLILTNSCNSLCKYRYVLFSKKKTQPIFLLIHYNRDWIFNFICTTLNFFISGNVYEEEDNLYSFPNVLISFKFCLKGQICIPRDVESVRWYINHFFRWAYLSYVFTRVSLLIYYMSELQVETCEFNLRHYHTERLNRFSKN